MSRISKQPDLRRQELLDIGIDLFFKYGDKGITIQQVVNKANVATGLFYYYFKSKDQFLDQALNSYIERRIQLFDSIFQKEYPSLIDKLNCILDEYFSYVKEMSPYRFDKAFHTERHYALTDKLINKMKNPLYKFIEQGVEEGIFKIDCVDLATDFILNGIVCVFDVKKELSQKSFHELKTYVCRILMMQ